MISMRLMQKLCGIRMASCGRVALGLPLPPWGPTAAPARAGKRRVANPPQDDILPHITQLFHFYVAHP
jgi:hypothetical protein